MIPFALPFRAKGISSSLSDVTIGACDARVTGAELWLGASTAIGGGAAIMKRIGAFNEKIRCQHRSCRQRRRGANTNMQMG